MVMIRDIYVESGSVIEVVDSLYQAILFKGCYRPVDCIKGNRFQVLSYLIENFLRRWMICVFHQRFEYLSSLVSYSETPGFQVLFESVHHLCELNPVAFHNSCNNLFTEEFLFRNKI